MYTRGPVPETGAAWPRALEFAEALGDEKAAGEDRQARQHHALGFGQELVAPVERRSQGLMPRHCRAMAAGEERETVVEPGRDALYPKGRGAPRRKLDRQRDAVEAATDFERVAAAIVDSPNPIGKSREPVSCDLQAEARLADAAGAGQGDQPMRGGKAPDRAKIVVPADQLRHRLREIGRRRRRGRVGLSCRRDSGASALAARMRTSPASW